MTTPLPPVPNVAKIVYRFTVGDDTAAEIVLHCAYTATHAPMTQADCDTFCEGAENAWETQCLPNQATVTILDDVTLTDLHTVTGNQSIVASGAAGGDVSAPVTGGVAMVVGQRTGTRGRSFRGRTYVPGMPRSALNTPQLWLASAVTTWHANFVAFNTQLLSIGGPLPLGLVVVSYFSGVDRTIPGHRPKPIRRVAPVATLVNSFTPNLRIGSQRRRNL
jgi:hypothetical protein